MNNTNNIIQKLKSYKFINLIVKTYPYIIAQEKNALVTINGKLKIKGKTNQFLANSGVPFDLVLIFLKDITLNAKNIIEPNHLYNCISRNASHKQNFIFLDFKSSNSIEKIYETTSTIFEKHNWSCKFKCTNFRTTINFLPSYNFVNEFILQDKHLTSLVELNTLKSSINFINPNPNSDQNS